MMASQYNASKEHLRIDSRAVKAFDKFDIEKYRKNSVGRAVSDAEVVATSLMRAAKLGIVVDPNTLHHNFRTYQRVTQDSLQPLVTTPSISTPIQFLQTWMPGYVEVLTAARKADEILGLSVIGNFYDEQLVQGLVERSGNALPYGDYINVPLSNFNTNFVYRTVVRFVLGMRVDILEEQRAAAINLSVTQQKRSAIGVALEVQRNLIAFFGYNNGANFTYGFLNDPELLGYTTVPEGASTFTQWTDKTANEIVNDILLAASTLRTQSQDLIDPRKDRIKLVLPTNRTDYLNQVTQYGFDVWEWLRRYNPNIDVVSAPQLNAANGGANVFYLFAEQVNDESTDDRRTWVQMVPARSYMLKVEQKVTGFIEGVANATAGVMLKRPWAVTRWSGI